MGHGESTLQICIVEDDADTGDLLAELLTSMGHSSEIALSAESLLMRDHFDDFDLFLIDLGLPGLDGITLARTLRNNPDALHTSMVAVTGRGNPRERVNLALQAGFDAVYAKPMSVTDLARVLAQVRPRVRGSGAAG